MLDQFRIFERDKKTENSEGIDFIGAPGRNRTCGAWIRNPLLYPLSYGGFFNDYSILRPNSYILFYVNLVNCARKIFQTMFLPLGSESNVSANHYVITVKY
jgi:hypothetical protein